MGTSMPQNGPEVDPNATTSIPRGHKRSKKLQTLQGIPGIPSFGRQKLTPGHPKRAPEGPQCAKVHTESAISCTRTPRVEKKMEPQTIFFSISDPKRARGHQKGPPRSPTNAHRGTKAEITMASTSAQCQVDGGCRDHHPKVKLATVGLVAVQQVC